MTRRDGAAHGRAPRVGFVRYHLGLEVFEPNREEPRFRRLVELLRG